MWTNRSVYVRISMCIHLIFIFIVASGCGLSEEDWSNLRTMGPLTPEMVPPSPTNAWADDPEAAVLGQAFFFDTRMSADGTISCASCHAPENNFADPNPVSEGVEGRKGNRHAPTLINLGFQDFYFWDGRTDSLWSTPLQAIEAGPEADFTRTEVVHLVMEHYRVPYTTVFGPLPEMGDIPKIARPGLPAWETMSAEQRDAVNRVFANVGKALEAYQRKLICADTRFDRIVAGQGDFSETEERGAVQFLRSDEGNCFACHNGLNFSNNGFHRLPLPGLTGFPDLGREEGVPKLLSNTFNTKGAYSDDTGFGNTHLADVDSTNTRGLFKTPTLRGVAQRETFGHLGNVTTLDRWLDTVYDTGRGRGGRGGRDNEGFDGRALNVNVNNREMSAFLRTLDCEPLPASLLGPPEVLPGMDVASR